MRGMRKSREKELRARKEKFPLRDFSRRGNAYQTKGQRQPGEDDLVICYDPDCYHPNWAHRGRCRRPCRESSRSPCRRHRIASPTRNPTGSRFDRASGPSPPSSSRLPASIFAALNFALPVGSSKFVSPVPVVLACDDRIECLAAGAHDEFPDATCVDRNSRRGQAGGSGHRGGRVRSAPSRLCVRRAVAKRPERPCPQG